MNRYSSENAGCLLVAEYVDEAKAVTEPHASLGQVVATQIVAEYIDTGTTGECIRDFTILLKDDRVLSVRGHGLRMFPPTGPGVAGSYGVICHADGEQVLVALFSIPEVVGIFAGEIRSDRRIA